jgi:hypothetical protein
MLQRHCFKAVDECIKFVPRHELRLSNEILHG